MFGGSVGIAMPNFGWIEVGDCGGSSWEVFGFLFRCQFFALSLLLICTVIFKL